MKNRNEIIMFICVIVLCSIAVFSASKSQAEVYAAISCQHLDNGIRYVSIAYQDARFSDLHQRPIRLYGWILKRWEIREFHKRLGRDLRYFDASRGAVERWCVVA